MMHQRKTIAVAALALALSGSSAAWAAESQSYGARLVTKASHGFANMTGGFVEIPKNVTNLSQEHNIFVGMTWGLLRGVGHTVGRTVLGVGEFLTAPIPTDDFVTPGYIWERFSEDTRYFGRHFPGYWKHYGPLDDGESLRTE